MKGLSKFEKFALGLVTLFIGGGLVILGSVIGILWLLFKLVTKGHQ